jgi:hypothetical protein
LRLLLDEHYPSAVAQELRDRGHDVIAVAERPELRELADARILELAAADRRAVVSENAAHFVRLFRDAWREGHEHYGIVIASRRRFSRRHNRMGALLLALDALLRAHPGENDLANRIVWIEPVP